MDTDGLDPKTIALFSAKTLEKLASKIKIGSTPEHLDSPCMEYTGVLDKDGYGRVGTDIDGKYHRVPASRLALEITMRVRLPKDILACHHCDNPSCVAPKHLFPGTAQDNTDDMIKKKRNKKV